MADRENKYDRVKAYDRNDWSFGLNVSRAEKLLQKLSLDEPVKNVNDAIEAYNVGKILSNPDVEIKSIKNSKEVQEKLKKQYFRFFNQITNTNMVEIYEAINIRYLDDFWSLFEKCNKYKIIDESIIRQLLDCENRTIYYILQNRNTTQSYGKCLREYMLAAEKSAEILIRKYIEKKPPTQPTINIPDTFTGDDYKTILNKYIDYPGANLNYLRAIFNAPNSGEFPIDEHIRLKVKKRIEDIEKKIFDPNSAIHTSITIGIGKNRNPVDTEYSVPLNLKIIYSESWLKKYLDFPTILNNFIYLVGLIDLDGRCILTEYATDKPSFLKFIGVRGKKEYQMSLVQHMRINAMVSSLAAYRDFLQNFHVRLEDVIPWFFKEYLKNEFQAEGFLFGVPTIIDADADSSIQLLTQFDRVLKEFHYYASDGTINQELMEMSSNPVPIKAISSLLKDKYLYANSPEIKYTMVQLFSDQSDLTIIAKKGQNDEKYTYEENFVSLIKKHQVFDQDFENYQRGALQLLKKQNVIEIASNGLIKLNKIKCSILWELYEYGVINAYYYNRNPRRKQCIENMIATEDVRYENTLFSIPEQNILNYILNKSQYSDGTDLRNKYIHGTYSLDRNTQYNDYLMILLIVIVTVLKINEEFCLKHPEENFIEWC